MSELPSELRAMIAQSRAAHEPTAERLEAVRARVLLSGPAPVIELPKPAKWGAWWIVGLGVVLTAVLLRPVPSAMVLQAAPQVELTSRVAPIVHLPKAAPEVEREPPASLIVTAPRTHEAPAREEPTSAERRSIAPSTDVEPAPAVVEEAPVPVSAPEPSDSAEPAHAIVRAPQREPAPMDLQHEVKLIARARKALARGDWADAERALHEHQRSYPMGQLYVERTALLVRTRCLAHDLASARRLHAQLATWAPKSSLLESVERACPEL
jgi:hypothetical protein